MKTTLFAAATFALALAAAPAFAGEGNSDPFPYAASGMTVAAQTGTNAAVSAETFPDPAGRPGSNLAQLADELLPEIEDTGASVWDAVEDSGAMR